MNQMTEDYLILSFLAFVHHQDCKIMRFFSRNYEAIAIYKRPADEKNNYPHYHRTFYEDQNCLKVYNPHKSMTLFSNSLLNTLPSLVG